MQARALLVFFLLGSTALFWFHFSLMSNIWLSLILTAPLFLFFGWGLKRHLETKIILRHGKLSFFEGSKRKQVPIQHIRQVEVCESGNFNSGVNYWMFLFLAHPTESRDEDSFTVGHRFGITNPEHTVTQDLFLFDAKTIADLMLALSQVSPQAQVVFYKQVGVANEVEIAAHKAGASIKEDPHTSRCTIVIQTDNQSQ